MRFKKLRQSIEEMPRPAYIFLKVLLSLVALMLLGSAGLFAFGSPEREHLAVLLLETPAGMLFLGLVGLAFLLDRLQ